MKLRAIADEKRRLKAEAERLASLTEEEKYLARRLEDEARFRKKQEETPLVIREKKEHYRQWLEKEKERNMGREAAHPKEMKRLRGESVSEDEGEEEEEKPRKSDDVAEGTSKARREEGRQLVSSIEETFGFFQRNVRREEQEIIHIPQPTMTSDDVSAPTNAAFDTGEKEEEEREDGKRRKESNVMLQREELEEPEEKEWLRFVEEEGLEREEEDFPPVESDGLVKEAERQEMSRVEMQRDGAEGEKEKELRRNGSSAKNVMRPGAEERRQESVSKPEGGEEMQKLGANESFSLNVIEDLSFFDQMLNEEQIYLKQNIYSLCLDDI